jgi:uncharacterized damage-inducible protein DinB
MNVSELQLLFDYGHWANRKLFTVISKLTLEQFTQPYSGDHGAVRSTMVHVLSAESGWVRRCAGLERGPRLNPDDYPNSAALDDAMNRVESQTREFLATLRDEDLGRIIEFSIFDSKKHSMPVGELLQHAANHGAHHRGQVSLLLRMLGYSPENFDLLFYFGEKHGLPTA